MPIADVITALKDREKRAKTYSLARDYLEGRHRFPYASDQFKDKFRWLLEQARANLMPTVVSNFTDLVKIQSWDGDNGEKMSTPVVHAALQMAVNEAFAVGDGWILVWPGKNGERRPWFHRADQVAYRTDPEDPDSFLWVAKMWVDSSTRRGRVNVYYPATVERWVTVSTVRADDTSAPTWPTSVQAWTAHTDDTGSPIISHDFGQVPWVHIPFDANQQGGHGRSILRDAIPLQDALNHALHAILVNVEDFAAPLRALLNLPTDVRINPATGQPDAEKIRYDPTKSKLMGIRGPGPLQEFPAADSTSILKIMDSFGLWIGRVVGMPPHDLVADLGNVPSGAALRVLTNRRTNAVRDFTTTITPQVSRLASLLGVDGVTPAWRDPAPADESELLEQAVVRKDLGFSLEENLREMGYDLDDIGRIVAAAASATETAGALAFRAFRDGRDLDTVAAETIEA